MFGGVLSRVVLALLLQLFGNAILLQKNAFNASEGRVHLSERTFPFRNYHAPQFPPSFAKANLSLQTQKISLINNLTFEFDFFSFAGGAACNSPCETRKGSKSLLFEFPCFLLGIDLGHHLQPLVCKRGVRVAVTNLTTFLVFAVEREGPTFV